MNPAESYILRAREPFRSIMVQLQVLIAHEVPGAVMRYRYHIPFYYVEDRPFCYINQSGDHVDLGFPRAAHFKRNFEQMKSKGRKIVRSLRYYTEEDIDAVLLAQVLREAYAVRPASSRGKSG